MLTITVKGFGTTKTKLQTLRTVDLKKAEERGLLKGMLFLEKYIKTHFTGVKTSLRGNTGLSKRRRQKNNKGQHGKRSKLSLLKKVKRPHSLPFQPPAVQSGKLRASIKGMVVRGSDGVTVGLIGAIRQTLSTNYDIYLELGTGQKGSAGRGTVNESWLPKNFISSLKYTTSKVGMDRRPYLQPAVERNERLLLRFVREEIRKVSDRKI